jgi:hypothetical protein
MKRTIIIRDADSAEPAAKPSGLPARSNKARAVITILCAVIADGLQWVLPFLWPVWDGMMVIAILMLWGWRWEILVAVIPELIPGLELAPTWTIFAGYIVLGRRNEKPVEK